jgi:hypothetical protein
MYANQHVAGLSITIKNIQKQKDIPQNACTAVTNTLLLT